MGKMLSLGAVLILMLNVVGCGAANDEQTVIQAPAKETAVAEDTPVNVKEETVAWQWQYTTQEEVQINSQALEALHEQVDSTDILATVIVRNGLIVDEYYDEGYDENNAFALHSCSKSITSALVGIAIDKGYIESVHTPIANYFPQIAENGSDYQKQITIWHLLTHTSGIDLNDTGDWNDWRASDNWVEYTLNRPVTSKPGTVFNYATSNTHLLSAILQKATGQTVYDFGRENLFEPLGMDSVRCGSDSQGISDGGNGFAMSVYDMAKFGQLYLNGGQWEGEQIISQAWITDSTTLQFDRSSGSADYGYQWWVRTFGDEHYPAYFAQGHGGQYIFVVPDLSLITVITSNYTGSSSMYWQLERNIVQACQ